MTGSVTFTPTEADYVGAVRANYLRRLAARRFWVRTISVMLIAVVVVGGVALAADGDAGAALATALGGLAGGIAVLAIIIGLNVVLVPRRAAQLFRQQRTIHQRFDYHWSDAGLRYESATTSGESPWADFRGWRETGPAFLVYMNDTLFQFLPRRVFDDAQAEDLRATLKRSGLPIY